MKRWILVVAALTAIAVAPAAADSCGQPCGQAAMAGCGPALRCGSPAACGGGAACGQMPGCGGASWTGRGTLHSSHDPSNIWYRGPAPGRTLFDCCPTWKSGCDRGPCGHPRMTAMRCDGKVCCGSGPCCGKCGGPAGRKLGCGPSSGCGPANRCGPASGCGPANRCGPGAAMSPTSAKGPGCGPMTARRVAVRTDCGSNAPAGRAWHAGSWDTGWKKCASVKRGGACCPS